MSDIFADVKSFQEACEQKFDLRTAALYVKLVNEECEELNDSFPNFLVDRAHQIESDKSLAEVADALIDIIYVCAGCINALELDAEALWNEVQRSNMAKIDPLTGKVTKRADGKIRKPEGWLPPDLLSIVKKGKSNESGNGKAQN